MYVVGLATLGGVRLVSVSTLKTLGLKSVALRTCSGHYIKLDGCEDWLTAVDVCRSAESASKEDSAEAESSGIRSTHV